jgi:catechol 2,3-dioxygenase-like lactoylglutathione lyase family enzyme
MKHMAATSLVTALILLGIACSEEDALPGEEDSMAQLGIQANLVFFYYPDLDAAERFYTGLLGLEKVLDYGFARICRISESTYIGLVDETKGMHDPSEPKTVTLAFVTDEVDGWYDYLVEQGVEMRGPLGDATRHPTRGFVAYDPAGYFLEFERFLDHPQNVKLHAHLEGVESVYPPAGQETTRPAGLGVRASVFWLYYKDIPGAERFYEDVFGASQLVDQGFAKVYSSSTSGFVGLVDEAQGLHRFSEKKAVNVSFLTEEIDGWYARFREKGASIKDPLENAAAIPVRAFVGYDPAGYFIEFDMFLEDPRNIRILELLRQ